MFEFCQNRPGHNQWCNFFLRRLTLQSKVIPILDPEYVADTAVDGVLSNKEVCTMYIATFLDIFSVMSETEILGRAILVLLTYAGLFEIARDFG